MQDLNTYALVALSAVKRRGMKLTSDEKNVNTLYL